MHPISVECHVRMRHATLSAEVRFVLKNLIETRVEEEEAVQEGDEQRGIDPGDVVLAVLAWLPGYSWEVNRMASFGVSYAAMQAVRETIPVRSLQSTRSMHRVFELLDRVSSKGKRVTVEELLYVSLTVDSEFLGMFVSEVLRRQDGIQTVSIESILRAVHAPGWMIEEAIIAAESPIDKELRELLASA